MSDAQHPADHQDGHDSLIKTPNQLIAVVVAAFVIPVIAIVLLVKNVGTDARTGAGAEAMSAEAIALRIQPVGRVQIKLAGGPLRTGEVVFKAQCGACHAAGLAGAPKFGDAAAWAPRIKNSYEALLTSALKGKNAMSPQGGGEFNDVEVGRAVVYMANAGGGKFAEPAAPAASAASAP
jgi:cytochrome c5